MTSEKKAISVTKL